MQVLRFMTYGFSALAGLAILFAMGMGSPVFAAASISCAAVAAGFAGADRIVELLSKIEANTRPADAVMEVQVSTPDVAIAPRSPAEIEASIEQARKRA